MNTVDTLTEALTRTNKYYTDANYGYPYTEANCTTYAYDTALYLMDQGKMKLFNRSGYGNACNWYNQYLYDKGSEPKVGAIMCWKVSDGGNQYGHVAICTGVNGDGTVDFVQGAYGGKRFYGTSNYNYHRNNFAGFMYLPNYEESKPTPTPTPTPTKSIDEIAKEVIAGKWGNGQDRKNRITAAGYDYSAVQARVNEILHGSDSENLSIDEIAREVIKGKWGNGAERRQKLIAAGYNYEVIQKRVNELLRNK